MTGKPECPPESCFYCRMPLAPEHEHDHIPPKRQGGTETVAACINCHSLKDRIPLDHWPVDMVFKAFEECGPLGRILLAKAFAITGDQAILRAEKAAA